jgi:hypothetical protein
MKSAESLSLPRKHLPWLLLATVLPLLALALLLLQTR